MGRRSVFGAVGVALATAVLSGCGGPKRAKDWEDAITKVEGVTGAHLERVTGAEFQRFVRGTIETEGEHRAETLRIYGAAMHALAQAAAASGDEELICGAVVGRGRYGHEVNPFDLRPDLELERKRLDAVGLKDFLN